MVDHNESTKHPIALSFSDASFWCYSCDSYIDADPLRKARAVLSKSKFAAPAGKEEEDLAKDLEKLNIAEEP